MKTYSHLFFDLDGTLTDSQEGIVNSMKHALSECNVSYEQEDFKRVLGPPLSHSFSKFFDLEGENIEKAIACYRKRYEEEGLIKENKLYPGVYEMLEKLSQKGYSLSMVTSKPEVYARRIAEHFQIAPFFDDIYGATLTDERGHKIDVLQYAIRQSKAHKDNIVMIGDRMYDLEAAQKAGVHAIGVLYGYGERDELEKYKNLCLAENICDLLAFFE